MAQSDRYILRILEEIKLGFVSVGVLAGLLIWFIISLVEYIKRDKNDPIQCRNRLTMLILSGAVLFVVIGAVVALIFLVMAFLASM